MTSFYTNVQCLGNSILYRGVVDGKRVKQRIDYSPSLFLPSRKEGVTQYTSLDGDYLVKKKFDSIRDARDYIKQFDGVSGAPKIYGQTRFEYAFIAEMYRDVVDYDMDKLSIGVIDIEVGSENGFPDPYEANEPITAIAIKYLNGDIWVFGCGDYETKGKEKYVKCKDEYSLCKQFMALWTANCPDIITGWNTKFFDIPYLVNRFKKILGEQEMKKFRRSLFFVKDMNEGDVIDKTCVRSVRPGFGLHTKYYWDILGKKVNKNVKYGEPVLFNNIAYN